MCVHIYIYVAGLSEYQLGDALKVLPCFHQFHKGCIDHWLDAHTHCPLCNEDVLKLLRQSSDESVVVMS